MNREWVYAGLDVHSEFTGMSRKKKTKEILADQLLIPMAMVGGGKFRTLSPTPHTTTNAEIIKKFIDVEIAVNEYDRSQWEIEIGNG